MPTSGRYRDSLVRLGRITAIKIHAPARYMMEHSNGRADPKIQASHCWDRQRSCRGGKAMSKSMNYNIPLIA